MPGNTRNTEDPPAVASGVRRLRLRRPRAGRSNYFCVEGRFGRLDGASGSRDERLAFTMAPDATREGASVLSRSITFFFAMARRSPMPGSTVRALIRFVRGLGGPSASRIMERSVLDTSVGV